MTDKSATQPGLGSDGRAHFVRPPAAQAHVRKARENHVKTEESHVIQPSRLFCLLCACVLVVVPATAEASEVSGGVSLGGILAGTKPRFAVSPHAGISWRRDS